MEKQKPHQNVFKGLGDDWCNLSGSAWPNQRGTDGRHVELNSYAKHKYVNINKRIKNKGNRKQQGKWNTNRRILRLGTRPWETSPRA